jgi:hypothetical protein
VLAPCVTAAAPTLPLAGLCGALCGLEKVSQVNAQSGIP